MKDSEKLAGAKACVDGLVTSWRKTNLTDIEEWSLEEAMIWGVFKLALYLLPTSDYQKLKNYVLEEYGHDVGGAVGTFKYGVIENNAPGSFPDREKGEVTLEEVAEYCNDRNIEMVARDWLDSLNESLEKAVNIAKAYEESLKAFNARLEELEHETELLNADLKDGVKGVGMTRKCFEVRVKKELLRDVICFMEQAITEGSAE